MRKILLIVGCAVLLTSCEDFFGPSKAELEARAIRKAEQEKQDSTDENKQGQDIQVGKLVVFNDSLTTNFKIPTDEGSRCNGTIITVKHDGCEYIVWFNLQGQQVMHKPNCSNTHHK